MVDKNHIQWELIVENNAVKSPRSPTVSTVETRETAMENGQGLVLGPYMAEWLTLSGIISYV